MILESGKVYIGTDSCGDEERFTVSRHQGGWARFEPSRFGYNVIVAQTYKTIEEAIKSIETRYPEGIREVV